MGKQYNREPRIDKEEIWLWYQRIQEYWKSGLSRLQFCKDKSYPYARFNDMYNLIEYKSKNKPKDYKTDIDLVREWHASELTCEEFCKVKKARKSIIWLVSRHLKYLEIIEEMKQEGRIDESEDIPKPMIFHKVVPIQSPSPHIAQPEPEVVKKQNDVELTIEKGIRVMVAPEVGADKLIRIIELLKDL